MNINVFCAFFPNEETCLQYLEHAIWSRGQEISSLQKR